jgi:hypothetical protein
VIKNQPTDNQILLNSQRCQSDISTAGYAGVIKNQPTDNQLLSNSEHCQSDTGTAGRMRGSDKKSTN